MRILTVSAFFETHGGGVEIAAGQLARALGRRGHDSRLAGAAFDSLPRSSRFTPVPLAATDPVEAAIGLPMPLPAASARKLLEQEVQRSDAVIIHDALYASSQLARRFARRHRKPWIIIQHIGTIPYRSAVLRGVLATANRVLTRPTLEEAPQVVFISDTVRRHFGGLAYRAPPKLLFNGVDAAIFHPPGRPDVPALRARLGLSPQRLQLLFVGRFVEKKGVAILRELAALRPDADLLMAGSGPADPAGWRAPNVRVLGRRSRSELADLYRCCDALVLPSVGEGFPLVIQEAMACGLPVCCGRESAEADPGASRFLTGIDIDLAQPRAAAETFAAKIGELRRSTASEAARYAHARYDWDANAAWLEKRLATLT